MNRKEKGVSADLKDIYTVHDFFTVAKNNLPGYTCPKDYPVEEEKIHGGVK